MTCEVQNNFSRVPQFFPQLGREAAHQYDHLLLLFIIILESLRTSEQYSVA
jgi:hypothetical protein